MQVVLFSISRAIFFLLPPQPNISRLVNVSYHFLKPEMGALKRHTKRFLYAGVLAMSSNLVAI